MQDYFSQNGIKYVDYKDTETLKKFLNPHGRVLAARRTGLCKESASGGACSETRTLLGSFALHCSVVVQSSFLSSLLLAPKA